MIRVLLADDHQLVRSGLAALLAGTEDIEVVGTAANGAEAVEMARSTNPRVVLMDLVMPVMDGVEATRRISAELPGTQVVVLTSFSDRDRILAALDAGAIGYLLKDVDPAELVRGVHAAARGESPLHPKAARSLLSSRSEARGEPAEGQRRPARSVPTSNSPRARRRCSTCCARGSPTSRSPARWASARRPSRRTSPRSSSASG